MMPRAWRAGSDAIGRDNETGFDKASEVGVVDVVDGVWAWAVAV